MVTVELFTDDDAELAERLRMIANHGQQVKHHHKVIGCNSRLDTLQLRYSMLN